MTLYIGIILIVAIALVVLGAIQARRGMLYTGIAILLVTVVGYFSIGFIISGM